MRKCLLKIIMNVYPKEIAMISQNEELLVVIEPAARPASEPVKAPAINVSLSERIGSVVAGTFLLGLALRHRSVAGVVSAVVGLSLVKRGATGRCSVYKNLDINTARPRRRRSDNFVHGSVTIKRSADELYHQWRDPGNFSKIFDHFARITVTSNESSHWVIGAPLNKKIEWDAWITEERPSEVIKWKSSDDSDLPNGGQLRFRPAPGDKGTELILELHFSPPGGKLGKRLADILGVVPRSIAQQALRRFKSLIEAGEIPRADYQPEARRKQGGVYESALLERS
jgi:uncharacterized membrane protein